MGMFLVSKAFGRESKLWKKELRNDDARGKQNKKNQRITKVAVIYPLGNVNVWSKFHCNISSPCWNISPKTTNVSMKYDEVIRIHHWGTKNVCTKLCGHPSVVEIFYNMWKVWPVCGTGSIRWQQQSKNHKIQCESSSGTPTGWTGTSESI